MAAYYGYSRISTVDQSDHSLANQSKYLRVQAESLGFEFVDNKERLSGKNLERPVLQSILSRLKKGDAVGVYDNSRLGRGVGQYSTVGN